MSSSLLSLAEESSSLAERLAESERLEMAASLRCPLLQLQRARRERAKIADKNIGHVQGYLEQEKISKQIGRGCV